MSVEKEMLVPGKKYCILIDDCCVDATLQGAFLRMTEDEDIVFDIGVFTNISGVTFNEIEVA